MGPRVKWKAKARRESDSVHSSVGIECPLEIKLTRTEILLIAFDVPVDLSLALGVTSP